LKNDVKSNGEVVLKKGTTITGVVKSLKRAEANGTSKGETKNQAQSMMEIEWLAPEAMGKAGQNLSFTLQSVSQVSPIYQHDEDDSFSDGLAAGGAASTAVARPVRTSGGQAGGGLLGVGNIASTGGSIATAAVGTVGTVGGAANSSAHATGQSNAALLNMPSVVAVDHQTSSAIENSLGSSSSGPLFKVGHGELITAGGSQQSLDIFSHLSNDTVITSPSKNFEITSGAQMQLLVGVNKK